MTSWKDRMTSRPAAQLRSGARRGLKRLGLRLWAAPCSAVGLACALPLLALRARAVRRDGVVEVAFARCPAWLQRCLPFVAITLGHVVIATSAAELERLRAHELAHVRQYERWGAAFFIAYAASSLAQWLRGGRPYWDNLFEREARQAEQAATAHPADARA